MSPLRRHSISSLSFLTMFYSQWMLWQICMQDAQKGRKLLWKEAGGRWGPMTVQPALHACREAARPSAGGEFLCRRSTLHFPRFFGGYRKNGTGGPACQRTCSAGRQRREIILSLSHIVHERGLYNDRNIRRSQAWHRRICLRNARADVRLRTPWPLPCRGDCTL